MPVPALVKAKSRATAIHLGISALIFLVVLYLIVYHWYPGVFFGLDGGWQGVRIMIAVDLILGPLLTLIIFNPAKSRRALTFDFCCIAMAQAAALTWGINAVYGQRPLAIVHWENAFFTVDHIALDYDSFTLDSLRKYGERIPVVVAARPPETQEEIDAFDRYNRSLGKDGYSQPHLYEPLKQGLERVFENQIDVAGASARDPRFKAAVEEFLAGYPEGQAGNLHFIHFYGRYHWATLAVTTEGEIVGVLPYVERQKGVNWKRGRVVSSLS